MLPPTIHMRCLRAVSRSTPTISPSRVCAHGIGLPSRRRYAKFSGRPASWAPEDAASARSARAASRFAATSSVDVIWITAARIDAIAGRISGGGVPATLRRSGPIVRGIDTCPANHVVEVFAVLAGQARRAADVPPAAAEQTDHVAGLKRALGILEGRNLPVVGREQQRFRGDRAPGGESHRLLDPRPQFAH